MNKLTRCIGMWLRTVLHPHTQTITTILNQHTNEMRCEMRNQTQNFLAFNKAWELNCAQARALMLIHNNTERVITLLELYQGSAEDKAIVDTVCAQLKTTIERAKKLIKDAS